MSAAQVAEQRTRFGEWLQRRAPQTPIVVVETHVSIVALGDDRVWKLKKAVRFPFIDLSTPELRRANAEREVSVNRRFAPDVYLGVVPLEDRGGEVVDTVVEMRRMPDERRLASLARTADPTACVDAIAQELARMHRAAPTSPEIDRAGMPATLLRLWSSTVDELNLSAGSVLDADLLGRVDRLGREYLAGRTPLLEARVAGGRIRDGHGDLLADDVFCLDDGPRLLDCLEFDDALRFGDVVADVAFLAMDLERLGRGDLARRLLDRYRSASGDSWPPSLADYYVAYRALIRSKVACLRVDADPVAAASARRLLALAADHLTRGRVRLVLVGGAPATGKTTLSRELERSTGWRALHSDEIRKHLAGLQPTTSAASVLDHGLYAPQWNARTYDALLESARGLLASGESVILDASWSDRDRRADAQRVAETTSSELVSFCLSAPPEVAEARVAERATARVEGSAADASDATAAVSAAVRARFDPWPSAFVLDATRAPAVLASEAIERLDEVT